LSYKIGTVINFFGVLVAIVFLNPYFSVTPSVFIISIVGFWLFFLLLSEKDFFFKYAKKNHAIVFATGCFAVRMLHVLFGNTAINAHDVFLIVILIFSTYYMDCNKKATKNIAKCSTVYVVMIAVVTLFRLRSNPTLCRLLARGNDQIQAENGSFFTATMTTITAFSIIFLMYCSIAVYSKHKEYFLMSLLILYLLLKSQLTIALVTAIMFFFVILWLGENSAWKRATVFFLVVIVIVVFMTEIDFVSDILMKMVAGTEWSSRRISELLGIIKNRNFGDGDWAVRINLTKSSIVTFIHNPILGHGISADDFMNEIGGHSTYLDMLAGFGILGGGSYILSFVSHVFYVWRKFNATERRIYLVVMLAYFFLSMINTTQNVVVYFTVLFYAPIMIRWYFSSESDSNENN
jgi:hypothetical protein